MIGIHLTYLTVLSMFSFLDLILLSFDDTNLLNIRKPHKNANNMSMKTVVTG